MKQELRDQLKTKPCMSKEITDAIYKYGTQTGSNKWNCATPESDYDIILPVDFPYSMHNILDAGGIYDENYGVVTDTEYFYSIYVKLFNLEKIYNLLLMKTDESYHMWYEATKVMVQLTNENEMFRRAIIDKRKRVNFFENLKTLFQL